MVHLQTYTKHAITLFKQILENNACIEDYTNIQLHIKRQDFNKIVKIVELQNENNYYVQLLLTTTKNKNEEDLENGVVYILPDEYDLYFLYNDKIIFSEVLKIGVTNKKKSGAI